MAAIPKTQTLKFGVGAHIEVDVELGEPRTVDGEFVVDVTVVARRIVASLPEGPISLDLGAAPEALSMPANSPFAGALSRMSGGAQ